MASLEVLNHSYSSPTIIQILLDRKPMQSFVTAVAHFALFLAPCLITTIVHIFTATGTDSDLVG